MVTNGKRLEHSVEIRITDRNTNASAPHISPQFPTYSLPCSVAQPLPAYPRARARPTEKEPRKFITNTTSEAFYTFYQQSLHGIRAAPLWLERRRTVYRLENNNVSFGGAAVCVLHALCVPGTLRLWYMVPRRCVVLLANPIALLQCRQ